MSKAEELIKTTYTEDVVLGSLKDPKLKVLVVGDSVGSGVGASSFENSVSGRLAHFLAEQGFLVDFKNKSVNGNRMEDVVRTKVEGEDYDLIFMIVSSNDLFHFTFFPNFRKSTAAALERYSNLGKKVVLVGPGRVYAAAVIPLPLRLIYFVNSKVYVSIMKKEVSRYDNVVYLTPKAKSGDTESSDKFHPNDLGHEGWFELIKPELESLKR